MMLILVSEMLDCAPDRNDGGIAQGTDGFSVDVIRDSQEQVDIFRSAVTVFDSIQDLMQPHGSFAAGGAFPAGFVLEEPH
jgi:hypothetical protein